MPDDGDITLTVGGATISGWTDVDVDRGIERMPNSFEIAMTEKFPDSASDLVVQPGDVCTVSIGGDLVITGYVDRFEPSITPKGHTIRVVGRSKSCDMVDCSAEWPNGQIVGNSALQIVTKLAMPYGIKVKGMVDTGAAIPQFNLTLGESAYAISERICRYRQLLLYDDPDGSVILNQAGAGDMASGLIEGTNVQSASASYSMDQRYSDYVVYLQSMETLADTGEGGNLQSTVNDSGVKRHRQMDLIAEAGGGGLDVAKQRAIWELNRRAGRANVINAVVDSWRDSAGTLWTPNFGITLTLPSLKCQNYDWVIGHVRYSRNDEAGTTASLEIMPKRFGNVSLRD